MWEVISVSSEQLQAQSTTNDSPKTKMLGAHVDVDLYWTFKKAAAGRNERLKEAITHAARMYIDAAKREGDLDVGG